MDVDTSLDRTYRYWAYDGKTNSDCYNSRCSGCYLGYDHTFRQHNEAVAEEQAQFSKWCRVNGLDEYEQRRRILAWNIANN